MGKRTVLKYIFNRYVLFTLVAFLVIGIPSALYFSNILTTLFFDTYEDASIVNVEAAATTVTENMPLNKPVTGEKKEMLDRFVKNLENHVDVDEVRVWSVDGTLVYTSDPDQRVGEKRKISGNFAVALKGNKVSRIEYRETPEAKGVKGKPNTLEFYFPVHDPSERTVTNVFEIYAPLTQVESIVSRSQAVMASFFFVLFIIVVVIGQTGAVVITRKDLSHKIERNISNTLQEALLEVPGKVKGVKFSFDYHSATKAATVGGDFYDIYELGNNRVYFAIGDVSGSGFEAAALTAEVKNSLRAYSFDTESPAEIMTKTNIVINKLLNSSAFVTVFLGILDLNTLVLAYCNAGHPPAILKRDGTISDYLVTGNLPIGFFTGAEFSLKEAVLEKEDILILYTDGITEARRGAEFFGEERLALVASKIALTEPRVIVSSIVEETLKFSKYKLIDDAALLVVKVDS